MTINLGLPHIPEANVLPVADGIEFQSHGHFFTTTLDDSEISSLASTLRTPLSVILQVTRRCNFDCSFCSETEQLKDPTLKQLECIKNNLSGVPRVFISGGEPLIRRDIVEITEMYEDFVVAIPTNATRGVHLAPKLAGKAAFINVGLEGPRNATNRVRGDYDAIMRGIFAFKEAGLDISLSSVVLRSLVPDLPYLLQIADVVEAGKVKQIHPIRKGNGASLPDTEFLSISESEDMFMHLQGVSEHLGLTPTLRMTTWTPETEGYSILIYPNGTTWAWPVYGGRANMAEQGGTDDKTLYIGNVLEEPITTIWERYPFKVNHLRKYLGRSIYVSYNGDREVADARRKQSSKK